MSHPLSINASVEGVGAATWRPAMIALDIDGTLLPLGAETVPPAMLEAVRRTVDAGVHVVLATGRRAVGTQAIAEQLGLAERPAVCSNGAVTVLPATCEVLAAETFDATTAVRLMQAALPEAVIAVECRDLAWLVSRELPDSEIRGPQQVATIAEMTSEPVLRLVVHWPDAELEEFVTRVEAAGLQGVNYAIGYSAWLDVMAPGVSKASALEALRKRVEVPADRTAAIGDGLNDLEMLAWGTHSVAMGSAPVQVQDAADEVALPAEEDGAAAVLNRWFAE